jgi:hypothetical protein
VRSNPRSHGPRSHGNLGFELAGDAALLELIARHDILWLEWDRAIERDPNGDR